MNNLRFCGNCGAKLEEDAVFCTSCGSRQDVELNYDNNEETVGVFGNTNNLNNASNNIPFSHPINNTEQFGGQINYQVPPREPQKKNNAGLIIGIVAAVLVVLAVIGFVAEKTFQNMGNYESSTTYEDTDTYTEIVDEDDKTYSKGILTSTTYLSDFIGVRYTAPSGWAMATESELAEITSDANTSVEMQAVDSTDGTNVILMAEKLATKNFTESMYIDSLKSELQKSNEMTLSDIKEEGTYTIAGESYRVLSHTGTTNGVSYKQSFYIRKINTHMIVFTITSHNTDHSEILDRFRKH